MFVSIALCLVALRRGFYAAPHRVDAPASIVWFEYAGARLIRRPGYPASPGGAVPTLRVRAEPFIYGFRPACGRELIGEIAH